MLKLIERRAKYKRIADNLINGLDDFEYIRDSEVRIAYLASDEEKIQNRKIVYAQCIKVNAQYQWCCHYDFMIVVYEPNIAEFNREQVKHLIEHELHHVGINNDGNEPAYYIVPHDVEEFNQLIEKYGIYWSEENAER